MYDDPATMYTRVYISSFSHTVLQAAAGLVLLRTFKKGRSSAVTLTAFGLLLGGANTVFKSLTFILSEAELSGPLNTTDANAYFYLILIITHIILALGLSMLIAEELRKRLQSFWEAEKLARREQNNFWGMVSHEFKTPLATIGNSS